MAGFGVCTGWLIRVLHGAGREEGGVAGQRDRAEEAPESGPCGPAGFAGADWDDTAALG